MKQLFSLLALVLALGCTAPKTVQHIPAETHPVVTQKEVPVELTATIPARDHTGTAVVEQGPTMQTWDWPDASTTLKVTEEPGEIGKDGKPLPAKNRYDISTTVKAQTITIRDTIPFLDTLELMVVRYAGVDSVFRVTETTKELLYTVTNDYQPCAEEIPVPPTPGSPWWKWGLWLLALGALLVGVGQASKQKTTT